MNATERTFSVDQTKHIIEAHHEHNERAFIDYSVEGKWKCRGCFMHGSISYVQENGY